MSSDDNSKRNKMLLLAGGAVLAAGAAWYVVSRGAASEPEPVLVAKKKPTTAATAETTAPGAGVATEPAAPAAAPSKPISKPTPVAAEAGAMQRENTFASVNEYSFQGGDNASTHDPAKDRKRVYQPPAPDANGVIFYDSVGVRVQVPRGWTSAEETSPMPNVAMLSFTKAEYAERPMTGMPGEVPVVLLSIEDISNESIGVDEFREKSKAMALGQMQMMTNGTFRPNVREDAKLGEPIGPFTHILMYELDTPYFSMKVMNLTAVVEGLAYIMQVMSNGNDFTGVRKEVVAMAKTMAIQPRPAPTDFRTVSSQTVTGAGGAVSAPAAWLLERSNTANPVFRFTTASQSRAESVEVHNAALPNAIDLTKPVAKESVTIRGVTVTTYGSNLRVATKGDAIVSCTPKHTSGVLTPAETLASICESVDFNKKGEKDTRFFYSAVLKLGFTMADNSRIIESRVSERILVYAPAGLPTSASDELPMLTVRVGDPSNDPDCRTSHAEWMQRIKEETDGESISDLKEDKIGDRKCVTFVNKEMQEVGPGMKEERTAKVIIFLTGVRTTMLRWETASGAWRKHEAKLKTVVNSLQLDD